MKKIVSSTKKLAIFLVVLFVLFALIAAGITLIVLSKNEGNVAMSTIGKCVLAVTIPIAGIVLVCFNYTVCIVWTDDGQLKRRGMLWGFKTSFRFDEISSVSVTYDNKKIFLIALGEHAHCSKSIEFDNTDSNMRFLQSFWPGDVFNPNK